MSRRYPAMLAGVALLWGASFMFIKVAVRELAPATLVLGRIGIGALTLALIVPFLVGARATVTAIRENAGWLVLIGLVNMAVSGVAAVANSSVPIFVAVLAVWFAPAERSTGLRLVGILLGLAGVAILAGVHPAGGWQGAAGTGAIVLASVQPPVVALATTAVAALAMLPFGLAEAPHHVPHWKTIGAVLALAIPLTAFAFLLFYAIIAGAGAAYASLVTYLVPPIALLYGAIFLGERFGPAKLGGLALILGGVALGAGRLRLWRRPLASEA